MNIAFIGGGNMATALISGLCRDPQKHGWIHVSDPSAEARQRLQDEFPVQCFAEPGPAIDGADIVILAVKPQVMPAVLDSLVQLVGPDQTVVSIAAGITVSSISKVLGDEIPVIRCMPNTPALIGKGVSGLFAGPACEAKHERHAEYIMNAAGQTVWLREETLMDVVTAVSGSGPAYYFLLTEALRDAGEALGLAPETAAKLALHTAEGAGAMAAGSEFDVSELRRRVTSPGGTTQAAVEVLEAGGFRTIIAKAVRAATDRGRELSGEGPGR